MKRIFLLMAISIWLTNLSGQTIDPLNSYILGPGCFTNNYPVTGTFTANSSNFSLYTDTVRFFIDHGDGSPVEIVSGAIFAAWYNPQQKIAQATTTHYYSNAGVYDVTVIAQFPDNSRDTLIYQDGVSLTLSCNNLTGRIFRDNNSNCTYDNGDQAVSTSMIRIWTQDYNAFSYTYTDANGNYSASVEPGQNYKIGIYSFQNNAYTNLLSCSVPDTISFTATANNSYDFPLLDTTYFSTMSVIDTNQAICYNAVNGYTYLNGVYEFYTDGASPRPIQVQLFYGDGNDTTFVQTIQQAANNPFYSGGFFIAHQYPASGQYSVMMICTDLQTGITDTAFMPSMVEFVDSCGSVSGYYYVDQDNNCSYTSGEGIPNLSSIIVTQNNTYITTAITNSNGYYSLDLAPGVYTLDISYSNAYNSLTPACSQTAIATIIVGQSATINLDFGTVCAATGFDNYVNLTATFFRPAQNTYIYPIATSMNCNLLTGTATLILDPLTNYIGTCDTSLNVTATGNVLTWPYSSNLNNNLSQIWDCIMLTTDSSAQIGDTLCFTFYISPSTPDLNPSNDTIHLCFPVINSYDPNMKEVRVAGMQHNGDVTNNQTHEYTIHFQNTGNDVAYNVFILDTLDSHLNPATLTIIGSSHTMEVDYLNGDVLKFNFNNINLPDSASNEAQSHGWIKYTIAQDQNLQPGTVIENTAHIFFDINPAIITNTTVNTIINPNGVAENVTLPLEMFPVPANTTVQVRFNTLVSGTITLYNTLGQPVLTQVVNDDSASIDVRVLPAGIYQLQVVTEKGIASRQLLIQR